MASATLDSPRDVSRSRSRSANGDANLLSDGSGTEDGRANNRTPEEDDEDDADLFGDDADGNHQSHETHRKLDDEELDSGDDEGRQDRLEDTVEDGRGSDFRSAYSERKFLPAEIGRIKPLEAENDELYILNMPPFLGLDRRNFNPDTYQPPKEPHDNTENPDGKFSPFSTAASTVSWRHDPQDPTKLQSNARIVRWSDGSLTLQLASSPKDQYRISTTALRQTYGKKNKPSSDYDPNRDAHYYLGAPHTSSSLLQIVAPVSAAMRILPTGQQTDDSVQRLQASLAAASALAAHDPFASLKTVKEDPEMARKAAEMAEKEMLRTKRKKEAEADRQFTRRDKVLGRSGLSRGGGLSIAGLEDEDGMPTTTRPKKGAAKPKRNHHGVIYSDNEDEGYPRGRTKEDEYDLEDDFMAASDEEPEIYDDEDAPGEEEDDPDVDDLAIEGRQTVVQAKTRGGADRGREVTPKRSMEDDVPAVAGSPHAGRKKRRVIDDDDDEE